MPKLLREPKVIDSIATEPDVLPTISASLVIRFRIQHLGAICLAQIHLKILFAFTFVLPYKPSAIFSNDQRIFSLRKYGTRIQKIYMPIVLKPYRGYKTTTTRCFNKLKSMGDGMLKPH